MVVNYSLGFSRSMNGKCVIDSGRRGCAYTRRLLVFHKYYMLPHLSRVLVKSILIITTNQINLTVHEL